MQKTALVTGGAGFVGSHLCAALAGSGYRVISLDNYEFGSEANHVRGVEYRKGRTHEIAPVVPERPDIIFHLGEYARVESSLNEPALVWDLNDFGTIAVLEYWRMHKCKLVYAGSSTKLGDGGLGRWGSLYALTKAQNTERIMSYARWWGLPYAITYFYNVYGPGERPASEHGTVIETFRRQYLAGEPLTVVSPGTQERNFTHVADIVAGLLLVGEKGRGDGFGLGSSEKYSILDVAKMFGGTIDMKPERAGNRMESELDTYRATDLGWRTTNRLSTYIESVKRQKAA